tara:strand:- start:2809 stop:3669 length:861 start_codon:yes stop_codon:yes gene_type:complete
MSQRKGNDVFAGQGGDGKIGNDWQGDSHDILKDTFGLTIPTELAPLPSKGIVYPEGHALHLKESIEIRAMTAREEDILTNRAYIKQKSVINELIKSCLLDKRINPEDMIAGDRNAVMTSLRITGYGPEYTVEVDCPSCGERSKQDFDLASLPIKNFNVDPIAVGANAFEFKLPLTTATIRFKYLNGHEEKEINTIQERLKKQGIDRKNLVTQKYETQVIAVNGIEDKVKVQKFCQNMPARDSLALRKFMDANEPGIEMKSHMNCPHCYENSEVRLPIGASFFWPDA